MTYVLLTLALTALAIVFTLAANIRTALLARSWPQHRGEILSSTLKKSVGRLGPWYTVHIRYQYSVGQTRIATCILPSFMGTMRGPNARRLADRFHVGARVDVFVDPRSPERAVLLPGVEAREWSLLVLMACVSIGGVLAAIIL